MEANAIAHRPCPVCNSGSSRVLFSQTFEPLSDVNLLDGYDVAICEDCGAGFADKIPDQDVFDAYYRDLSKYEYAHRSGQGSSCNETRFRHSAKTIAEIVPDRQSRVLEIGCSTGHLLSLLKELGYESLLGVDPSPGCSRIAKDNYGIIVETHSIFDIPEPEKPFDLIVLIGVMEHLRSLDMAVRKIRSLLSPGGIAYIAVPDAARFGNQRDAPFQEFSLEHLNYFSPASLTNLMQSRGFEFVSGSQSFLEHSGATWCSVLHAFFRNVASASPKTQGVPPGATNKRVFDSQTEAGLTEYIRKSRLQEAHVCQIISALAAEHKPVLVWGTGAHTQRLLRVSDLAHVNITAFIDSNPKYQGQTLRGIPIWHPDRIRERSEAILISSYAAQREIENTIRAELTLKNDLILLYDLR